MTLVVTRSMRHGGTASAIQKGVTVATGEFVSLAATKSALWHLVKLGLVEPSIHNNARTWKAVKSEQNNGSSY